MAYRVELRRSAQRQVLSLPRPAQIEIAQAIDKLREAPRPAGCKKLRETELWRLRVGRYRIIYSVDDAASLVTVVKVAARREDTYRGL